MWSIKNVTNEIINEAKIDSQTEKTYTYQKGKMGREKLRVSG